MQTQNEILYLVRMDEERESHLNLKEPFAPSEDLKVGLLTRKIKGGYIGNFEDIPEQEKDNEYLQTGYRIGYEGWAEAFNTFFMWHNETVNVWSHFLGAVAFLTTAVLILMFLPNMKAEALTMSNEFNSLKLDQNLTMQSFID